MAIELGRVNVRDLTENSYKKIGIGINSNPSTDGIFSTNYTTLSQAKDNIKNLLLTQKGERLMQPDFGCDIWRVLFEQSVDGDIDFLIENAVVEAVNIWLPYLTINQIIIDNDDEQKDNNRVGLEINFSLASNPNLRESVKIVLNN
jgi:phage baseplate assembly protein W